MTKKPDALISCTGIDFTVNGKWTDEQNSAQYIVLSQPDGTYRVNKLDLPNIYGHQAAAIDVNGDGNVDIITVDPYVNKTPFILWGKGDGTFTADKTRFPADMYGKSIYGVVSFNYNNETYVVASGATPYNTNASITFPSEYGTKILRFNKTAGKFEYVVDLTPYTPNITATGLKYSFSLDAVYKNGYLYTEFVSYSYAQQAIVKFKLDLSTGTITSAEIVSEFNKGDFSINGFVLTGIFKFTSQNQIVNQTANCGDYEYATPSSNSYDACTFSVQQ